MEPKITYKNKLLLAGIIGCAPSVTELDIAGLWDRFITYDGSIDHQVGEIGYEVHIEEEVEPRMHFCLVGVEINKVGNLPAEFFLKEIPAGKYAAFTHHFKDGGFGEAFEKVYDWIKESDYQPAYPFDIQLYDDRFKGPEDSDSVFEIFVPVKL